MSEARRVSPHRPSSIGPNGVRRIVVQKRATETTGLTPKPLRNHPEPKHWHMAIAHSDRGGIDDHAVQAIAAAAILADPDTGVLVVVLGELTTDLSPAGADLIAVIPDYDSSRYQPEQDVAAVAALIEKYAPRHIFMPDNATGDGDLGRRLAARLGCRCATQVIELDAAHAAVSWSGGSALAVTQLPRLMLLKAGAVERELPFVGAGKMLSAGGIPTAAAVTPSLRDLGLQEAAASAVALDEADFIVSAGAGVRNVETMQTLATSLGAAVGASRVAVDEGKFTRDRQIGATGKTVSASAYIAVGISGAVQHLQGIKDCRHVIAINKDASAPIAKRADLTVAGDAEEVMQALITRIAQARAQREVPEGK